MVTVDKRNEQYYTPSGILALENRTKTLIKIFNENKFPFSGQMLGFGKIVVSDQKECLAKILEISSLIGFNAKLNMNKATGVAKIEY